VPEFDPWVARDKAKQDEKNLQDLITVVKRDGALGHAGLMLVEGIEDRERQVMALMVSCGQLSQLNQNQADGLRRCRDALRAAGVSDTIIDNIITGAVDA
jgi:hypothetical protein